MKKKRTPAELIAIVREVIDKADRAGDTKQSREDWISSVIAERDLYKVECALFRKNAERYRWLITNGRWRASWWQKFATHEELSAAIDSYLANSPRAGDVVSGETNE